MSNSDNKNKDYLSLSKLESYKKARELSRIGWRIFNKLNWEGKRLGGFDFVESTDSVGANIAEGYGRFHYLDKAKFYYNARGSLLESRHWFDLLEERGKVEKKDAKDYENCYKDLRPLLNGLIRSVIKQKS